MAIPLELQRTLQLRPLGISEGQVLVAPLYPLTVSERNQISASESGLPVVELPLDRSEVMRYLRGISATLFSAQSSGDFSAGFTASLLEAIEAQASDLHIRLLTNGEPCHLRRRIHGYLQEALPLDVATARRFVTWAKQKAGLDSSDHLRPQEGRFALQANGVTVEFPGITYSSPTGVLTPASGREQIERMARQIIESNLPQELHKLVELGQSFHLLKLKCLSTQMKGRLFSILCKEQFSKERHD